LQLHRGILAAAWPRSLEGTLVAAYTEVLMAQRLRTSALQYYCFNIMQQKWVTTLHLLSLINQKVKEMHRNYS